MTSQPDDLRKLIPEKYLLVNTNPIVIRSLMPRKLSSALNEVWVSALIEATAVNEIRSDKYIRFNVTENDDTVAISIYPTNTIMIQGHEAISLATKIMENFCTKVKLYQKSKAFVWNVTEKIVKRW